MCSWRVDSNSHRPAANTVQTRRALVEHIHLRQRCFDGSLAQLIKPRLAAAVGGKTMPGLAAAADTYTSDFPDVKFHVAALKRYRRKQSGSGIRTTIWIGLKSYSARPCPDICRHATFHPYPCTRFWVILLTDRHGQKHLPAPLLEVMTVKLHNKNIRKLSVGEI